MRRNILTEMSNFPPSPKPLETNFEEFKKVAYSRRSVRVFTEEKIPDEIVKECLRIALHAPSSSNLQPWEFYWIKTESIQKELVRLCLGQPAAKTAPTLIVCVSRTQAWREYRFKIMEQLKQQPETRESMLYYYSKLIPIANGFTSPLVSWVKKTGLFISGLSKPTPRVPCSKEQLLTWAHKSTALACENLMLAFRAAGYDTCPMEGMDKVKVKKLLNLPQDADVCMVISAGRRAENGIYGKQLRLDESLFIKEV